VAELAAAERAGGAEAVFQVNVVLAPKLMSVGMQGLAIWLMVGSATICGYTWWQIGCRVHLFYAEYGGRRWVNHVSDGTFEAAYVAGIVAACLALVPWRVFRESFRSVSRAATVIAVFNVLGVLGIFLMHRSGILVTYMEFIHEMTRH
jgi:hypothetical protein